MLWHKGSVLACMRVPGYASVKVDKGIGWRMGCDAKGGGGQQRRRAGCKRKRTAV